MTETEEPPRPAGRLVPGLALVGTALLLAGTFCPAVVPAAGAALSYRGFSGTDGNILLGVAAVSFVLTWVFRWYRGLFVTGGLALFMIAATLLKVPRSEYRDAALGWGWLPLVAGAVLLLTAALLAEKQRPPEPQEEAEPVDDEPGDI